MDYEVARLAVSPAAGFPPADLTSVRITFVMATAGVGGGTLVVAEHAQRLIRLGHQVQVVSAPIKPGTLREKLSSWTRSAGKQTRHPSVFDEYGVDHRVLDRSRPVEDRDVPDADVVIATWWETAEWIANFGPEKGAKAYFIQHHEVFPYLPVERCRATYRLPFHKIVIAQWLRQVMASEYGDTAVDLVPNSVDKTRFFAPERGKQPVPTVGLLYSPTPFKALDVSLAALQAVRSRLPNLRILSFGSMRPLPQFPLPAGTDFFLSPPRDKIRNIYDQCDVWVTASRSEGFNLPAMEAMACRTPVVSTRTGWPAEAIVSGSNGVLVDIDDVEAIASGIEWVLAQSPDAWERLSANAFSTVASSSWDASAKLFEGALLNACARAARREIAGGVGKSLVH
ncbi:MAG: glycosyltransferase family 4 protein [Xanthobacteraceae bacterium]|nr:glycosyltransferase family 4 protein [Xanthobacteraceae bacterium]